jgi:hypothetical protein
VVGSLDFLPALLAPTPDLAAVDVEQVEHPADRVVDDVVDGLGGATMAPISVTVSMLRRWTLWSGVSRVTRTNRRRSLSTTSAARVSRLDVTPDAISPSVRIEHGAITMPIVRKDPLDTAAPTSCTG